MLCCLLEPCKWSWITDQKPQTLLSCGGHTAPEVKSGQLVARLGADQGPAGPDQLHHHGEGELPEVKSGQLVAQLRADPRSTAGPAKQGVIVVHAQHLIEGGQVGVGGQPTGLDGQEGHHK